MALTKNQISRKTKFPQNTRNISSLFEKTLNFLVEPKTILTLVIFSVMLALLHMHLAQYGLVNGFHAEHFAILRGESTNFTEANNGGHAIIPFYVGKVLHTDDFTSRLIVTIPVFCLIFILLYIMTQSLIIALMPLIYPPLIVDSYLIDTAFVICCILLVIYFYQKNKKNIAFFWAIPLALYRHEGIILFAALFLHEIIKEKQYLSIKKFFTYINTIKLRITLLLMSLALYFYLQYFFFGNPLANFILNVSNSISLNFPWYYAAIRWVLIVLMIATSCMLFSKSKFLFWANTALAAVYITLGVLGFEYTFYAILKYYSWMFIFSIFAIGFYTKLIDAKKWDV